MAGAFEGLLGVPPLHELRAVVVDAIARALSNIFLLLGFI